MLQFDSTNSALARLCISIAKQMPHSVEAWHFFDSMMNLLRRCFIRTRV